MNGPHYAVSKYRQKAKQVTYRHENFHRLLCFSMLWKRAELSQTEHISVESDERKRLEWIQTKSLQYGETGTVSTHIV